MEERSSAFHIVGTPKTIVSLSRRIRSRRSSGRSGPATTGWRRCAERFPAPPPVRTRGTAAAPCPDGPRGRRSERVGEDRRAGDQVAVRELRPLRSAGSADVSRQGSRAVCQPALGCSSARAHVPARRRQPPASGQYGTPRAAAAAAHPGVGASHSPPPPRHPSRDAPAPVASTSCSPSPRSRPRRGCRSRRQRTPVRRRASSTRSPGAPCAARSREAPRRRARQAPVGPWLAGPAQGDPVRRRMRLGPRWPGRRLT